MAMGEAKFFVTYHLKVKVKISKSLQLAKNILSLIRILKDKE